MRIIVTDLTRFKNEDYVCIAGSCLDEKVCVRPMPYLKSQYCKDNNILPGAILEGDFTPKPQAAKPHTEDYSYTSLNFLGPSSPDDFLESLCCCLADSVEDGFGVKFEDGQKHIPLDEAPSRSIITVGAKSISIVEDKFKPGKLRAIFTDNSGKTFWYLSITDLGFYYYAQSNNTEDGRRKVNSFLRGKDVYLRIGLSREHSVGNRVGYWMQVNGIYTFPDYLQEIRCHK